MNTRGQMRRYLARLDEARSSLARELEEEVAPVRGLSVEERGAWVASACAAAWAIARSRPDLARLDSLREPPAPDFAAKWMALVSRRRARD